VNFDQLPEEVQTDYLDRVRQHLTRHRAERADRLQTVNEGPSFEFALGNLRYRLALDADLPLSIRGSAFRKLCPEELAILDRQMEIYKRSGRLDVPGGRDPELNEMLNLLRVNLLVGDCVDGPLFREQTAKLLQRLLEQHLKPERDSVIMVPWRASILFAEAYYRFGVNRFWHLGAKRNHETLKTEIYYERVCQDSASGHYIVCDPMLATGNTDDTAVSRLLRAGVPEAQIEVVAIVSAPEGVDFLLRKYPKLRRILTVALDAGLDPRGYIEPGLGDFGDFAMRELTYEYAQTHWVETGILMADEARRVLIRTAEVERERRRNTMPPVAAPAMLS